MKQSLGTIGFAILCVLAGLFLGFVVVLTAQENYADSIANWHTKRGPTSADYLIGMRERAGILAEAVDRNNTLALIIQQSPSMMYEPVMNILWHQNVIIIQTGADYWRNEIPAAGYEQFHFSATHTADMCADLVEFTENLLWPTENYNYPSEEFASARIEHLYLSCFDGLAAIFALLDMEAIDA